MAPRIAPGLVLVLGVTVAAAAPRQSPRLPSLPPVFDSYFTYKADDFITLTMRGIRGEHGHVTEQRSFSAWRIDTLLGDLNLTTVYAAFRNDTHRATSFFTAGTPVLQRQAWREASLARLARSPAAPRVEAAPVNTTDPTDKVASGVFVGGCAAGSQEPLGIIGVDLSWVYDPSFQVSFVGEEVLANVTTQHWTSRKCRDVWIRTWSDGEGHHAAPVRVRVLAISDVVTFGCQPPVQSADFSVVLPLDPQRAATTSPLFMPPPECAPSSPSAAPAASGDGIPPWVWVVVGGLVCLGLGSVVGFLVGVCRRRGEHDGVDTRERFSSHLLDVI